MENITCTIGQGEVVGILGPNSIGKTTLFRLKAGLYIPTSGSVSVFGKESAKLTDTDFERIGFAQQQNSYPSSVIIRDYLRFIGVHYGKWDESLQEELLKLFELDGSQRMSHLSPGTNQRLSLICAVCHHPALLMLDEPVASMDPIARARAYKTLIEIAQSDRCTIVISSHILSDIEGLIKRIIMLKKSKIVSDSSVEELRSRYSHLSVSKIAISANVLPRSIQLDSADTPAHVSLLIPREETEGALNSLATAGVGAEVREPNLEEIYQSVMVS